MFKFLNCPEAYCSFRGWVALLSDCVDCTLIMSLTWWYLFSLHRKIDTRSVCAAWWNKMKVIVLFSQQPWWRQTLLHSWPTRWPRPESTMESWATKVKARSWITPSQVCASKHPFIAAVSSFLTILLPCPLSPSGGHREGDPGLQWITSSEVGGKHSGRGGSAGHRQGAGDKEGIQGLQLSLETADEPTVWWFLSQRGNNTNILFLKWLLSFLAPSSAVTGVTCSPAVCALRSPQLWSGFIVPVQSELCVCSSALMILCC